MKKLIFALFFIAQAAFAQVTSNDITTGKVRIQTRVKQGSAAMIDADTLLKVMALQLNRQLWIAENYSLNLTTGTFSKFFVVNPISAFSTDKIINNSHFLFINGLLKRGLMVEVVESYMWSGLGTNNDYYFEKSTLRVHFSILTDSNFFSNNVMIFKYQAIR